MDKLKVVIVESSTFYKKLLTQAVEKTGIGLVETTASDSTLALEKIKQRKVDVMLLDFSIPGSNFVHNVENIKKENPGIFIILSCTPRSAKNISKTDQPDLGVLDLIIKPPVSDFERGIENIKNQLQGMFTQIIIKKYTSRSTGPSHHKQTNMQTFTYQYPRINKLTNVDLILIASSTGGPSALEVICKSLPPKLDKPVLIVQHMQTGLTKNLAQSLDKKSDLHIREAQDGDIIRPGQVLIAQGGTHMTIKRSHTYGCTVKLELLPPVNGVRPSADVLFTSVADVYKGGEILAVILTGMGSDGKHGVEELKKHCACLCLAQSERTCVVYGMPKSVVDAGLVDAIEDLENIPYRIAQVISGKGLPT